MKILLKKEICRSCKQCTDPLTDVFFNLRRCILAIVDVGPTEHKRQTQNVEGYSCIQTLTKCPKKSRPAK